MKEHNIRTHNPTARTPRHSHLEVRSLTHLSQQPAFLFRADFAMKASDISDYSVLLGSATLLPTAHWKTLWLPSFLPLQLRRIFSRSLTSLKAERLRPPVVLWDQFSTTESHRWLDQTWHQAPETEKWRKSLPRDLDRERKLRCVFPQCRTVPWWRRRCPKNTAPRKRGEVAMAALPEGSSEEELKLAVQRRGEGNSQVDIPSHLYRFLRTVRWKKTERGKPPKSQRREPHAAPAAEELTETWWRAKV